MQKLFSFIVEKKHWFLLLLLQAFSLNLYLNDGAYKQGLRFYVATGLTGRLNELMTKAYGYLEMYEYNQSLLGENARLEQELVLLRRQVVDAQAAQTFPQVMATDSAGLTESYVTARVVNLRVEGAESYYVINKGKAQGIRADMPVMSATGVVGAIMMASEHYSIVIPVINPKIKLSCTVKGKEFKGQLSTPGYNRPVYFGGVPLHNTIAKGDTLVTSGYSYIFPEGLMVGTVEAQDQSGAVGAAAAFGTFRVKLATDFDKLKHVYVFLSEPLTEAKVLEDSLAISHDE